jgi:hypothetical protein
VLSLFLFSSRACAQYLSSFPCTRRRCVYPAFHGCFVPVSVQLPVHAPYICPASCASDHLPADVPSLFLSSFRACALHLSSLPCRRRRCVSGNLGVYCPCICPASRALPSLSLFFFSSLCTCSVFVFVLLSAHAPLCSVLIFSYSVLLNTSQEPAFLLIAVRNFRAHLYNFTL